ncbi:unnamed protein product [Lepeophtheirus salmonis]|uniref:(salmon louse) hypothetical protein n=1 Tax=Lepeophtheirus salmonis TaxID=72036 RepID=A0A7R8H9D8_LEPSM|nr:unnamed protein product [Lepeophtheirus salmonis]CAF2953510.1 unnamed protein product [Lepeophtheirus salmonis]
MYVVPRSRITTLYPIWKKDIRLWQKYIDIDKKKQAFGIYLLLNGKAREATTELKDEEIDFTLKDPGKIIGKDGKVYLLRHGPYCIRCHVCMVQKSVVKEDVLMVKTNVEAHLNGIDHGYGQIQTDVEEAHENVIASHTEDEDISNSNEEDDSSKSGKNPSEQLKRRRGRPRNEEKVALKRIYVVQRLEEILKPLILILASSSKENLLAKLEKPMEDIGDTWKEWKVVEDDHEVLFNINSGEVKHPKKK